MKNKFLILLAFFSIIFISCKKEKLVTVKVIGTNLEITLYESEAKLYDTYNKIRDDNRSIHFGKNKSTVMWDEIDEKYFPNNVEFLATALSEHDNIKKHSLKNGAFGVSYETKPNKKGKTDKRYIFYYKKDNKHYKFFTHLANYKMEHFDNVKNSMESLQ